MSFPIIESFAIWSNWANAGSGAWNMWFMAPYGEWVYSGFVKDNTAYFRQIDIGVTDGNYIIQTWDFGLASNTPGDIFSYEQHGGYPNGSTNLGCIRDSDDVTPVPLLFLVGRSNALPSVDDAVIHRFDVLNGFEQVDANSLTPQLSGSTLSVNQICGIEVNSDEGVYLLTNNDDSAQFQLHYYAYTGFNGGSHNPDVTIDLSNNYISNNTSAILRGIGHASDGNILVFANTGLSAIQCKVFKFEAETLNYLGTTTWSPNISASTWAYIVQSGEVFLHFQGLDSTSSLDWKSAVFYDRATGIPDASRSNFIIEENLTTFGDDTAITLQYHARDAWNIDVANAYARFQITGEDRSDSTTWTDRVGAIRATDSEDFFDDDGVPKGVSARTITAANGIALAYYKPMREGTGSEREGISVTCPAGE